MRPPESLRAHVRATTEPVSPLPGPGWRTATVVPLLVAVAALGPTLLGLRDDLSRLGALAGWGLTAIQLGVAAALVYVALRHAVPGRAPSARTVGAVIALAFLLHALATIASTALSPEVPAREETIRTWSFCFLGMGASGLLAIPLLVVLAMQPSVGRPARVGLLAGGAIGWAVDGGWRLSCNYSQPTHVLPAHGGAALAIGLAGLAVGLAVVSIRRLRLRRRLGR